MSNSYPDENDQIDLDKINGDIWEKHPDETDKQYEAFCHYRDLGRSRNKVEAYLNYSGKSRDDFSGNSAPSNWYEWSKKNQWDDRVEAWDKRMDEKKEEKMQEEAVEYAQNMAKSAQEISSSMLEAMEHKFKDKSPQEKAELLFSEQGLDLESFARTLTQAQNIADKAFGRFEENDGSSGDTDFLAEIKKIDN